MKSFFFPFRIVYKSYFLLVFVLSLLILFPIYYYQLFNPKRFPSAFVVMRFHAKALLFLSGVRLKVEGVDNIPLSESYIICPNHSSFLDILCIYSIFSQYFVFTGKKEIEKWPIFHIFYTSGMNILVDRHHKLGAIKAFKRMAIEISNKNPLVIFPEGTISKNAPKLAPFKPGSFAIAIQNQVPILPLTFVTNWKLLERKGVWKGRAGPGIAHVIVHKPVDTTKYSKKEVEVLNAHVYDIISGPLLV